jgi:protein SCO1/2
MMLGTVLLGLCLSGVVGSAQDRKWSREYLPNVPVVTQTGRSVRFYDDMLKGKIVVISFIYTSCRDICPVVTARLSQVEEKLGDAMGRDIFFVSVSVDPVNDTPEELGKYAEAFHAGPGWTFLTGAPSDIDVIRYKLGERSKRIADHRNEIMLYNDANGAWERTSVFGDLNVLAESIHAMDPAWRSTAGRRAPVAAHDGSKQANHAGHAHHATPAVDPDPPGQALFIKLCSGCHTVGQGPRVGPDLIDVSARRSREWLNRFIANPAALRTAGDPVATTLAKEFSRVSMPTLGLSDQDIGDLLAYIEARTFSVRADQKTVAPVHDHQHHGHQH